MEEDPAKGCVACGWTLEQQEQCCYSSHVKLFYGASRRGVWSIGSDIILKERPDEGPKKRKRIKGKTLEQAWPTLSESQKTAIADQVVQVRKKLRSLTSESIQTVDHGPCEPALLFPDRAPHGRFHSDLELWNAITIMLRHPPCEPYVLTHCDLNLGNLIVRDGALVGILDWEFAAYYPVWYEYVSASWGWTEDDAEWKRLLQQRMEAHGDGHRDAKDFWMDLCQLRKFPNLDEKGQQVLESLSAD
ncbi:phosphotransferase enzyme family-domain-containing protein [Aspergillus pseudonomiae]|uniref:Phosphotransferase enzyme family-domain-containing protein n=1 Tax=Aspergillus pseudonomiae TaxID=1506151 RepID=A0A5N7DEG9_9EURO|nr:phosphotransferase enzyme family-domain-containing protein [Aspergillus pseudonomiae]KAE8404639.1 phosphotransferase enzyme family-domain-containing protein [Aspergillus pseudonomiae]